MICDALMEGEFVDGTDTLEITKIQEIDERCAALEDEFIPLAKGRIGVYDDEPNPADENSARHLPGAHGES